MQDQIANKEMVQDQYPEEHVSLVEAKRGELKPIPRCLQIS